MLPPSALEEHAIAQEPRNSPVSRAQASPHPPLRVIRQVLGVVAPPGAVVVPEVMVGILLPDPDGEFCIHWWSLLRFPPGTAGAKKPPSFIRAVVHRIRGDLLFRPEPAHRPGFPEHPPLGCLLPRLAPCPPTRPQDFLMLKLLYRRASAIARTNCVIKSKPTIHVAEQGTRFDIPLSGFAWPESLAAWIFIFQVSQTVEARNRQPDRTRK